MHRSTIINNGRSGVNSSPAEAAVVTHPNGWRSRRSPLARPPPKERGRLCSPRAFEMLPARGLEPILDPDPGSWIWLPKAEMCGPGLGRKHDQEPPAPGIGRHRAFLPSPHHSPRPGLERGSPRSSQTPWGTQFPARVGDAFSLGTRFSTGSSKTRWHAYNTWVLQPLQSVGMQLGTLRVGVQNGPRSCRRQLQAH